MLCCQLPCAGALTSLVTRGGGVVPGASVIKLLIPLSCYKWVAHLQCNELHLQATMFTKHPRGGCCQTCLSGHLLVPHMMQEAASAVMQLVCMIG